MKKIILLLSIFPLISCNKQAGPYIPPPYSFSEDSWDVINKVAKGGLKNLIDTYHPSGDTFIITAEDDTEEEKAAKTRKVHIDGIGMFDVRVIGEEHDVTSKGKTALTFEIISLLHSVPYNLDASSTNVWSTSHLRKFLNNRLIQLFTPELQGAIKSVQKETLDKQSGKVKALEEKVFPLSYTEIGGAEDEYHAVEGKKYKYYGIHSTVDDRMKDPEIVGEDRSNAQRYWLRSPTVDSNINCYYVNEHGNFSLDDICIQLNVAPAFAI